VVLSVVAIAGSVVFTAVVVIVIVMRVVMIVIVIRVLKVTGDLSTQGQVSVVLSLSC